MPKHSIMSFIKKIDRPVFTTRELSALSGKSSSTVIQSLNYLCDQGLMLKIYRGIWAQAEHQQLSPYAAVPFLLPSHRAYVSFISALHLYGIIEQIPQEITLASTAHSKKITTGIGAFSIHRLTPGFFKGFGWYKGGDSFLIAEPEKALVDSFYISACRKKQFGFFPEMHFSKSFSFKKVRYWVKEIPDIKIRSYVREKVILLHRGSLSARSLM